jgi:MFS family permease
MLKRSFRHRNYRLFFTGQLVSLVGTWMQTVAQSWLVYRLTGSPALLGLVGFASQIPILLLAPLGGAIADRHHRLHILLATQATAMVLASVLAFLTLTDRVQVWEVFVLAGLLGMVNAFDIPTRQAFVVEMVGREDLPNAIALNSSMFNGARLVGPALAGLMVAAVGEGWCFLFNAASFLAVLGALLAMRLPARSAARATGKVLGQVVEGLVYVARTGPIRSLLLLLGLSSLTGMSYVVLMPVFANRILGGGPLTLGALMSAAGLGALLAALTLAMRRELRGISTWIANGALGFGLGLTLFAWSSNVWLSMLLLVGVGYGMMVQMASTNTLVQAMVPDAYRGRAMAAYSMMFMGMAPFGALLAGLVAENTSAPTAVTLGGGACVVGALLFRRGLPALRSEARRLVRAQADLHATDDTPSSAKATGAGASGPRERLPPTPKLVVPVRQTPPETS